MRLRDDVEWCVVGGEIVAIDPGTSSCVAINRSGAALWPALAEGADEAQLLRELTDRFGIGEAAARRDVSAFLDSLRARNLLCG
ncbi:MAG: PqqD family protein [Solirubrobacteraceae bacterium]